jgi:hypothetical protein
MCNPACVVAVVELFTQSGHVQALGIGVGRAPTVFAFDDRSPERHASDNAVQHRPAKRLGLHEAVFEVADSLLRIRRRVDPASTAFARGIMVGRPSSPGSKENERSMATRRLKLMTRRPYGRVDEARKPRPLFVRDHEPAPPTRDGLEVVGRPTQPRPHRARKAARQAPRSVPLGAPGPRAARLYTCASVRRPPLPTLRTRSTKRST